MRVVHSPSDLSRYLDSLYAGAPGGEVDLARAPLLIDRFLEAAIEVDVDAVYDGSELYLGGIMEHVEQAGVHSGDSACVVPARDLTPGIAAVITQMTEKMAEALEVRGLLNIQFAVRGEEVFVLEANPRASRTVPFISKATGVPLAKIATRVMMGETIASLRAAGMVPEGRQAGRFVAVKEAVLPWSRFPEEDIVLGPEMRATGEVMGLGRDHATAFAKAQAAAGHGLPGGGAVFISLADADKPEGVPMAEAFRDLGFRIFATHGTAGHLARHAIPVTHVDKVGDGPYDPVALIEGGVVDIVVNTPRGGRAQGDGRLIRMAANRSGVPCMTTLRAGLAAVNSVRSGLDAVATVTPLQHHHGTLVHG